MQESQAAKFVKWVNESSDPNAKEALALLMVYEESIRAIQEIIEANDDEAMLINQRGDWEPWQNGYKEGVTCTRMSIGNELGHLKNHLLKLPGELKK